MLSQLTPRTVLAMREQEEIADALGGSPQANKGLHLATEHEVITRDMPDPNVLGAIGRKKAAQDIQAWESPDREPSQLSMIQGTGEKESLRNSNILPGIKLGRRDSEELQAYSRQEVGDPLSGNEDRAKENKSYSKNLTGVPSAMSKNLLKNSGSNPNSQRAESAKKGKKDTKASTNIAFKEQKGTDGLVTVENYTKSRESEPRDIHQRMQQSVLDKAREKNIISKENKDLQVSKDALNVDASRSKGIDGKQRASRTQVAFDDQIGLSQDPENSRESNGAAKTKGILKSQKSGA